MNSDAAAGEQDDAGDGSKDESGNDVEGSRQDRVSRPFDSGLQPERTALAWRRTALALVVAAVVGMRVLPTVLGGWAILPAGTGIALAVGVLFASHYRYQQHHHRLTTAATDRIALPDGALPALVAGMTGLAGVACIAVVATIVLK